MGYIKKHHKKSGFTLVEIIVTLVILAILAAFLIPSLTSYIDKAKEKQCQINRSAIMRHYKAASAYYYNDNDEDVTLQKLLNGDYSDFTEDINDFRCPSGGVYSVAGDGKSIICSIHDNGSTPDEPDPGDTYPGTSIALTSAVWPEQDQFVNSWDSYTLPAGVVFLFADGKYYAITQSFSITKHQAANGPEAIKRWAGITQFSGTTLTADDIDGGRFDLADNGDVYDDGSGNYYVYTSYNGVDAPVPTESGGNWYQLTTN